MGGLGGGIGRKSNKEERKRGGRQDVEYQESSSVSFCPVSWYSFPICKVLYNVLLMRRDRSLRRYAQFSHCHLSSLCAACELHALHQYLTPHALSLLSHRTRASPSSIISFRPARHVSTRQRDRLTSKRRKQPTTQLASPSPIPSPFSKSNIPNQARPRIAPRVAQIDD